MSTDYDDSNIRVLEGLEGVRSYPGMFIGSTGSPGLHHLVYEVVDNSIDEALAGHCKNIDISINTNGSITVIDDGRGIPAVIDPQMGKSKIETLLTVLHAGSKFGDGSYTVSGGLHGVGIAVVSALSSHVEVKVWWNLKIYTQYFERGIAVSTLEIAASEDDLTGTSITFLPDLEIFKDGIEFDFDILANRFRELAYLNADIAFSLTDYRLITSRSDEPTAEYHYYPGGLRDYVAYLNRDKQPLHEEVIYAKTEKNEVRVEVALQWCSNAEDRILGFANTTRTIDGGTHLESLKIAINRTLNKIARQRNKLQLDNDLAGKYICEGLTAIVSVILPYPEWAGSMKTKLANVDVQSIVCEIVSELLMEYLVDHPNVEIDRRYEEP
jgi:DNA gyrase subunit B